MYITVIAVFSLLAWIGLLTGRGNYWRADQRLERAPSPKQWPAIAVIIPARDESDTIGPVISSHMACRYRGNLTIILVDDQSSDGTGHIAKTAAQASANTDVTFHLITASHLPNGWTGKLWALQQGLEAAKTMAPEAQYLLLTDADIVHAPDTLQNLVAKAEYDGTSLTSLMARLDCRGFWGNLAVPAFIYFFQKLYPFQWSNDPWHKMAASAGGCALVRRRALDRTGGVKAIKGALIDDCALARNIKGASERRTWLGLADREVISLRDNKSLASIWTMVARTAFTQLDYSWLQLIATIIAMTLIYLAAPLIILTSGYHGSTSAASIALAAWVIQAITYRPTTKLYGQHWLFVFTLPISAFLYTMMTISSGWQHFRQRGGAWKGRQY